MWGLRLIGIVAVSFAALGTAAAKDCGGTHVVAGNDTIDGIAERYYDDARKWTAIYYANPGVIGTDPTNLAPGAELRVPCLDDVSEAPPQILERADADLTLLTGGDYAPFTDEDLPGGGLITELVSAAFESSPSPVAFSLTWDDDWSRHLDPLLSRKAFDVGFPWLKPNCGEDPENYRCKTFHFSQPLFEMLVMLFVRADDPLPFESDADIEGATLCRPAGYYTHDLDRADRRWLKDGKITLVLGDSPEDCFDKLVAGEVDAVTVNEFLGRLKLRQNGLEDKIVAAPRPLSIEGLHVIISKTHSRGTTFLYRFNAGLEALKKSHRYDEIVDRHLSAFWRELEAPTEAEIAAEAERKRQEEERQRAEEARIAKAKVCDPLNAGWTRFTEARYGDAISPFEAAAEGGHPIAEYALGLMHLTGQGTTVEPQKGLELLERAASDRFELISDAAAKRIAKYHMSLDGKLPDFAEAYVWSRIALEMMPTDDPERATFEGIGVAFEQTASSDRVDALRTRVSEWLAANPGGGFVDCTDYVPDEAPVSADSSGSALPAAGDADPAETGTEPSPINGENSTEHKRPVPQLAGTDPALVATE